MQFTGLSLLLAALATTAVCKDIVITVGGNTTANAGAVFKPQSVVATIGDTVIFNFTKGNHTAIQSTFASPCIPAFFTNQSINGFNSGFRDAGPNSTAITQLPVPITSNETIWFFDANTCAQGGVGGININETSLETLDGFTRNAERLNGTDTSNNTTKTGTASTTQTAPGGASSTTTTTQSPGGASQAKVYTYGLAIPFLFFAGLLL